ncbi:DEAD/DEAH box helicase [Candidatus Woesearchaeota archaeon]|nr:DEAD/DEAH box helicase [Candidatus Woesearchaeota archaeon]
MQYKGFTLDPFQVESIKYLDKGDSVVVSAATGTGKTLIADYVIDKYIKENKRIIYTSPIKALSNQKFREFKEAFGEKAIGLLTGDVTINHDAQVLIMTTEIYRNMLVTKDELVEQISYVIFDEIHFISDFERGTVWEEAIIFSPKHVRFLCLSATIPNAYEFAEWIQDVKKHKVSVVKYDKRAVPLAHYLYDINLGLTNIKELKKNLELDRYPDYYKNMRRRRQRLKKPRFQFPNHIELVEHLFSKGQLPCLFFVFSRRKTEELADGLSKKHDFTSSKEKAEIISYFNNEVPTELKRMESVQLVRRVLQKGVGIHHAGLLPVLKEIVENLFAKGMISVLYATETFAVGVNMPAKTVCFNSLEKYDGMSFRFLNSKEYFQLAGRAGRRGIDKEGRAIAMVDRKTFDVGKVEKFTSKDTEPIISQFKLSYNTVINLIDKHDRDEQERILKSSLDYFLRKKGGRQIRIMSTFNHMVQRLKKMGYITKDYKVTDKGRFATHIYSNELLITEIFSGSLYKKFNEVELLIILAAIIYEDRRADRFRLGDKRTYFKIIDTVSQNKYVAKKLNFKSVLRLNKIVSMWATGCEFADLSQFTNLDEGDLIRLFRQTIDFAHQIYRATTDRDLQDKIHTCINKIQRDVVKVEF